MNNLTNEQVLEAQVKALSEENERFRAAIKRLASCETFCVSRVPTEEERARMFYAERVLTNKE